MDFDSKLALEQLTRSDRPVGVLKLMLGASHVYAGPEKAEFIFDLCPKANVCRIEYNPDDTYKMTFLKIIKHCLEEVKVFDGLFCDNLKSTFEIFTGLCLTPPFRLK